MSTIKDLEADWKVPPVDGVSTPSVISERVRSEMAQLMSAVMTAVRSPRTTVPIDSIVASLTTGGQRTYEVNLAVTALSVTVRYIKRLEENGRVIVRIDLSNQPNNDVLTKIISALIQQGTLLTTDGYAKSTHAKDWSSSLYDISLYSDGYIEIKDFLAGQAIGE